MGLYGPDVKCPCPLCYACDGEGCDSCTGGIRCSKRRGTWGGPGKALLMCRTMAPLEESNWPEVAVKIDPMVLRGVIDGAVGIQVAELLFEPPSQCEGTPS